MDQTISGGRGIGTAEKFGKHDEARTCLECRWLAVVPRMDDTRYRCGFGLLDIASASGPPAILRPKATGCKQYAAKDR
jgi:hypothetical protein